MFCFVLRLCWFEITCVTINACVAHVTRLFYYCSIVLYSSFILVCGRVWPLARLQMTFQLHEDSSLQIESFEVKKLNGVFVKLY